jgi:uncharacterized protein YkwD
MHRLTAFVIAIAMALTAAVSFAPAQPAAANSTGSYCMEPEEVAFLNLINQYRAQNGLGTLVTSQTVGAAAEHHSIDMATNDYFSHTLSNGEKWSQNMRDHGYTYNTFRGENIAAGNADAYSTFIQWQNSPGHNANMLNPNYTVIGIGRTFSANSTYGYYWTTDFGGYADGAACGGPAAPAPQPQPTTAPQPQPTTAPQPAPTQPSAPSGGSRSIRGGGGTSAPAPTAAPSGPAPSRPTYESGPRSIRG